MEIRVSVTQYVHDRIVALRQIQEMFPSEPQSTEPGAVPVLNNHPDAVAYRHEVKIKERLARKAKAKEAPKGSEAAATTTDADVPLTEEPVGEEAVEESIERAAEERENEKALKGKVDGGFKNVSVIRANAMKHLPNFFEKGQVSLA
jgi:tRNA (guanine-N7-)-methyltransferase